MDHTRDPFEHFGTFPNEIDPDSQAMLENAVAGIPFQENVFYVRKPELGHTDRDGDGLSDEHELNLKVLGFNPFLNSEKEMRQFREGPLGLEKQTGGLRVTLPGLPVIQEEFSESHTYPLSLQRSFNLAIWEDVPGRPRLGEAGFLEWMDPHGTPLDKVFYRVAIEP